MSALRAIFVDTGAWVALRYRRDQHHARARTLLRRLGLRQFFGFDEDFVRAGFTAYR